MAEDKPAVIVQARMGSERLPGKSMRTLAGKPLVEQVLGNASRIQGAGQVIVATSSLPEDDILADFCGGIGFPVFRGDALDVAARFLGAAEKFGVSTIIRICGDSPVIATGFMEKLLKDHLDERADLTFNHNPSLPLGPFGEVLSVAGLKKVVAKAPQHYHREHVSPYIHENPQEFRIIRRQYGVELLPEGVSPSPYRMTIDTEKDFEMMSALYRKLADKGAEATFAESLMVLQENPDIARINSAVKQKQPGE